MVESTEYIEITATPFYRRKWMLALIALGLLLVAAYKALPYYFSYLTSDVQFFEKEIAAFEEADKQNQPKPGRVLFTGSSSIRFWDSLQTDMRPLKVINRGFGGSMIHQVTYYADRIIAPYQPSAIVMYAGDNDIGNLITPRSAEQVVIDFDAFVKKVRTDNTDVPIIYIAIKPSTRRIKQWPEMKKVNNLIAARAKADAFTYFVDIATPMLNDDGKANDEYLLWDGLHMNEKGYALWTSLIRPVVVRALEEREQSSHSTGDKEL